MKQEARNSCETLPLAYPVGPAAKTQHAAQAERVRNGQQGAGAVCVLKKVRKRCIEYVCAVHEEVTTTKTDESEAFGCQLD